MNRGHPSDRPAPAPTPLPVVDPTPPIALPIVDRAHERSDAAANRERILCAARRVLDEQGAAGLSMNTVAAAAGVGKGTIFRRFGDRDGLTEALLDVHTIELQNGFLSGPPPLGPGAPPRERLEAFMRALVHFEIAHLELMLAADRRGPHPPSGAPVYGTFLLHIRTLLAEIDPRIDAITHAGLLLSAIAPANLRRLLADGGSSPDGIADAAADLALGLTRPDKDLNRPVDTDRIEG
ncbi:MAG TPA: TetR/AcrR family transcriptional regulator [Solirubrobacteraceae bacterium]|nr:TetR/AcrR family transcriptional regulator [Solirubrobacteraceae bacterium]